ncbi:hypothetical protein KFE98_02905 [bacterium SCSIO 12741]|nr:hypothetical protein KFE98_02905 [bacterium SCSIO 12741]
MRFIPPAIQLLILVLLGSVVRFVFGYLFEPWTQAPDQLAWQLLIDEGSWSYDQLIHYPHEGGSVFIALLSRFLGWFSPLPSLVVSAFLLDFFSRLIQMLIVRRVFGQRDALIFGIWTILALPIILPWGTVNYGLHSLASLFPFVLMYLIHRSDSTPRSHLSIGLFLGFAVWFSYINVVLIPVYVLVEFFRSPRSRNALWSLLGLSIVLGIHVGVRTFADPGFQLDQIPSGSIRGTEFTLSDPETWKQLYKVWYGPLADSLLVVPNQENVYRPIRYVWLALMGWGIMAYLRAVKLGNRPQVPSWLLVAVFLFLCLYALSPFYHNSPTVTHYVLYRHLCYILPLLALFVTLGLNSGKLRQIGLVLFIGLSSYGSLLLFDQSKSEESGEKAAGWVLALKFGHDPQRLAGLIQGEHEAEYVEGIGWGMGMVLLRSDSIAGGSNDEQIQQLVNAMEHFPLEYHPEFIQGVQFSTQNTGTPQSEQALFDRFLETYESSATNSGKN